MTIPPTRFRISELRDIIEDLPETSSLSQRHRKTLETELRELVDRLAEKLASLDSIAQPVSVFDPSNPKVIGRFVSLALVAQPRHPLTTIPRVYGSGVYAIYYTGQFSAYRPISNTETPIYVGQAAPIVSNARTPREQGPRLSSRLLDHQRNITKAATTLSLTDFEFRFLVVQSGWESAAEDYLIHLFRPIWNSETNILYGLGKHGDSAETRSNSRSPWDTMHPGRAWAARSKVDAKSAATISEELARHFSEHPVFQHMEDVLASFLEELRQV